MAEFYSTYARLILGFDESISKRIIDTSDQSTTRKTSILPITILTEKQVKQAMSDPSNESLKEIIRSPYVDTIKADRAYIKARENISPDKVTIEETLPVLDSKKRGASQASKTSIDNTMSALNDQYRKLNQLESQLQDIQGQVQIIDNDFASLTGKHTQELRELRKNLLDNLYSEIKEILKSADLNPLLEQEVTNLLREDNYRDLVVRFDDLTSKDSISPAEMERMTGRKDASYATYYRLKAYLAIRSVLTDPSNTKDYMKQLDAVFKDAEKQGQELIEKQKVEIKSVTQNKVLSALKAAESSNTTLSKLESDREKIVREVVTTQDMKVIEEKTEARTAAIPTL